MSKRRLEPHTVSKASGTAASQHPKDTAAVQHAEPMVSRVGDEDLSVGRDGQATRVEKGRAAFARHEPLCRRRQSAWQDLNYHSLPILRPASAQLFVAKFGCEGYINCELYLINKTRRSFVVK